MIGHQRLVERWVEGHRGVVHSHTAAILTTLFTDIIQPHGGKVSLGSIVGLCGALGISEATVRSSVARMANDGFLVSTAVGRRSDYSPAVQDDPRFDNSMYRVYRPPCDEWSGKWEIVALQTRFFATADRERGSPILTRAADSLCHDGFSAIGDSVFARPLRDPSPCVPISSLMPTGCESAFTVFHGDMIAAGNLLAEEQFIGSTWDIPLLEARYTGFVEAHSALLDELWGRTGFRPRITAEEAYIVRTLLAHDYRHIVMDTPYLPSSMSPQLAVTAGPDAGAV